MMSFSRRLEFRVRRSPRFQYCKQPESQIFGRLVEPLRSRLWERFLDPLVLWYWGDRP